MHECCINPYTFHKKTKCLAIIQSFCPQYRMCNVACPWWTGLGRVVWYGLPGAGPSEECAFHVWCWDQRSLTLRELLKLQVLLSIVLLKRNVVLITRRKLADMPNDERLENSQFVFQNGLSSIGSILLMCLAVHVTHVQG